MAVLFTILGLGALVLQIVMIVKFFTLCEDVSKIREKTEALFGSNQQPSATTRPHVNYDAEIKVGDAVIRLRDNARMIVEKTNGTEYSCLDASTREFMGIYSYRDVAKSED